MLTTIFILLVIYQLKHFIVDYPLQNEYMLRKFHDDPRVWIPALAAHAGFHAFGTFGISLIFFAQTRGYPLAYAISFALALFDFNIHFTMDRIKASPDLLGRYKALSAKDFGYWKSLENDPSRAARSEAAKAFRDNKYFWWSLGFDQMVHHLTHYAIIYILVTQ